MFFWFGAFFVLFLSRAAFCFFALLLNVFTHWSWLEGISLWKKFATCIRRHLEILSFFSFLICMRTKVANFLQVCRVPKIHYFKVGTYFIDRIGSTMNALETIKTIRHLYVHKVHNIIQSLLRRSYFYDQSVHSISMYLNVCYLIHSICESTVHNQK